VTATKMADFPLVAWSEMLTDTPLLLKPPSCTCGRALISKAVR
jgi:hypothetical protein